MINYSEMAEVAANWWAEQIKAPIYDNGDDSLNGFIAMEMLRESKIKATEEQAKEFKLKLKEYIENEIKKHSYFCIGVDYGPQIDMGNIAEDCGINLLAFPIKTNMWILTEEQTIKVRLGYSGEIEYLYIPKERFEIQIKKEKEYLKEIQSKKLNINDINEQISYIEKLEKLLKEKSEVVVK